MDPEKCIKHDIAIDQNKKDINDLGEKFSRVLFGETGRNGVVGELSSMKLQIETKIMELAHKFDSEKRINVLYRGAILLMLTSVIGLLIKLMFFTPK